MLCIINIQQLMVYYNNNVYTNYWRDKCHVGTYRINRLYLRISCRINCTVYTVSNYYYYLILIIFWLFFISQGIVLHATGARDNGFSRHSSRRVDVARRHEENVKRQRWKRQAQDFRQLRLFSRFLHARGRPVLDDIYFRWVNGRASRRYFRRPRYIIYKDENENKILPNGKNFNRWR